MIPPLLPAYSHSRTPSWASPGSPSNIISIISSRKEAHKTLAKRGQQFCAFVFNGTSFSQCHSLRLLLLLLLLHSSSTLHLSAIRYNSLRSFKRIIHPSTGRTLTLVTQQRHSPNPHRHHHHQSVFNSRAPSHPVEQWSNNSISVGHIGRA